MNTHVKSALLQGLRIPGAAALLKPFTTGHATVFMLHRFADPETGVDGHEPQLLRTILTYLRRKNYELVGLGQLVDRIKGHGPPPDRAVAFTIDDGYYDHAVIAAPVFAEFDCPVTTFVTTGFLDMQLWFWWDQIEYVFLQTRRNSLTLTLAGSTLAYSWDTTGERADAIADFTSRCKQVSNDEKLAGVAGLAVAAEVDLTTDAPPRYAPMTWDQLRQCEAGGMTFGAHTVTHPILAKTSAEQSREELAESWTRLCAEATSPVPVFCYPNGQPGDFGHREMETLEELGFEGAVTGVSGYASVNGALSEPWGSYQIRRFTYPDELARVIQAVTGFERVKQILRRGS